MEQVTLKVEGMSCAHCVRAVEKAMQDVDGVSVDRVAIGSATIAIDPTRTTLSAVIDALADAGYTAQDEA